MGDEVKMPVYPAGTLTNITIGEGESLSVLAAKYNTTVASIMSANGIKDANKIKIGQTLKVNVVSNEELERYNRLKAQYDQKVAAEKEKAEIEKRSQAAASKIEKAQKDGYSEDYDFSVNDKGHIIIKVKGDKTLGEIAEDFGLKAGVLRSTNPSIEQRYKPVGAVRNDGTDYETYDGVKANKDDTFVINTNDFTTERTWSQAFKDFGRTLKSYWPF